MLDHKPIVLEEFNGLWQRGDNDEIPKDHFSDCNNIRFIGTSAFGTRYGVGISQSVAVPLSNVRRFYNYPTSTGNTLIVLTMNAANTIGYIYHVVNSTTVYGPLLTLTGMKDFAFLPYAGRGYISPIGYYTVTGLDDEDINVEKGLENEFLYVYMGDGTAARKSAGTTPAGTLTIANGAAGHTDPGLKIFGVVGETDSGYLSAPVALDDFTTVAGSSVSFTNIPTFSGAQWTKRHIVASITIPSYNGNLLGYTLFFIPNATINDNSTTTLSNISFYDSELLDDASHLQDNFDEIPAGAALWLYHDRLHLACTFDEILVCYVSTAGEPEAIDEIDGLLVMPPDGNAITNGAELRDIDYLFKRNKISAFVDNGDVPSTWPRTDIDTALGTSIHGLATVLDSGSQSVDKLIVCSYRGIFIFTGTFLEPELTWKVSDFWALQDRNLFRNIQIVNDPVGQRILLVIPDKRVFEGNYANGMTAKNIRWAPLSFPRDINTIAIVNIDQIILGMDLL